MSITYTYEIFAVDEAARCMEVVYSAEGRQKVHIGARLPFEGEGLEDVIRAFAPIPLWEEQARAVVAPSVGVSGTIFPQPVQVLADRAALPTPPAGNIPQAVL